MGELVAFFGTARILLAALDNVGNNVRELVKGSAFLESTAYTAHLNAKVRTSYRVNPGCKPSSRSAYTRRVGSASVGHEKTDPIRKHASVG